MSEQYPKGNQQETQYGTGAIAALMGAHGMAQAKALEECNTQPPKLKQRLQVDQAYHLEQAEKKEKVIRFLDRHPEFAEFIELQREGLL